MESILLLFFLGLALGLAQPEPERPRVDVIPQDET
jgi:hypothetical protein